MGNQSSSASSSSAASRRARKPRLSKSASCGSEFIATESSEDETHKSGQRENYQKVEGEEIPKFHYNIHQPCDLLEGKGKSNSSSLLVKRHSSALEFISGKSPLRDYLKGKLTWSNKSPVPPSSESKCDVGGGDAGGGIEKTESSTQKFAKLLAQLSVAEGPKNGKITENVIQKCVIPHSPAMSNYLWKFLTKGQAVDAISESLFVTTSEKIFALHTDKEQINFYLKIFAVDKDMVEIESFMDFLISAYQLATVGEKGHEAALKIVGWDEFDGKPFLESVVKSCYHIKEEMSVCFLNNWLLTNLPRLHILMHKYILHQLTTGYTQLTTGNVTVNMQNSGVTSVMTSNPLKRLGDDDEVDDDGLKFECKEKTEISEGSNPKPLNCLNPILLWLLRSSLPNKFLAVFSTKQPGNNGSRIPNQLTPSSSAQLLMQLMQIRKEPETWSLLYDSDSDGLSINRFQFHLFNYKGPTLMILTAENGYSFAVAADIEWRESCHFWGAEEAMLVELQPEFRIVEKGAKLIYVNFSIRGYPFGIQIGKDPKNVSLEVKPDFSYAHFKKIPCRILNISAWGCAPKEAHHAQSEYKKWEMKQCENLRKININSAEWKDNPDKYLLELAGNYKSYDH